MSTVHCEMNINTEVAFVKSKTEKKERIPQFCHSVKMDGFEPRNTVQGDELGEGRLLLGAPGFHLGPLRELFGEPGEPAVDGAEESLAM